MADGGGGVETQSIGQFEEFNHRYSFFSRLNFADCSLTPSQPLGECGLTDASSQPFRRQELAQGVVSQRPKMSCHAACNAFPN